MSFQQCTHVTPDCPVEATVLGYYPAVSGNVILLVIFGICFFVQLYLGIRSKLPAFTAVVTLGCAGEAIGYGGRLILNQNPWSQVGFRMQIVCLILSPSFLAAGEYLTLKHLVLALGPQYSRLKPRLYPWIFIPCDAFSIILQAVGGGVSAGSNINVIDAGNHIIIAGVAFQVATMFVCLLLAIDFAVRLGKAAKQSKGVRLERIQTYATKRPFHFYLAMSGLAFITIFIRSVYRIAEMSGGWGGPLMQNQVEFMILEGAMIAIAAIVMSIAHPGIFFPQMRENIIAAKPVSSSSASEEEEKDEESA